MRVPVAMIVIVVVVPGMIEVRIFARNEIALGRRRFFRALRDALLKELSLIHI